MTSQVVEVAEDVSNRVASNSLRGYGGQHFEVMTSHK